MDINWLEAFALKMVDLVVPPAGSSYSAFAGILGLGTTRALCCRPENYRLLLTLVWWGWLRCYGWCLFRFPMCN